MNIRVHCVIVACAFGLHACSPESDSTGQGTSHRNKSISPTSTNTIQFVRTSQDLAYKNNTGGFIDDKGKPSRYMPETMGPGVITADFNGDGLTDIVVPNGVSFLAAESIKGATKLYINQGDFKFEDASSRYGLDHIKLYSMGGAAADIDADGDIDLILTGWGGAALLINEDNTFVDATIKLGLPDYQKFPLKKNIVPEWPTSIAIFDVDSDRDLDILSVNYVSWSPDSDIYTSMDGKNKSFATPEIYNGQKIKLYLNEQGHFRDASQAFGLTNLIGKGLGLALWDFDNDTDLDVFVANDKVANFLLENHGDHFKDVALPAGVAYDESGNPRAGMGIDIGNIWNKNQTSIVIGNFSGEPTSLFDQKADFLFQEKSRQSRIYRETYSALTFGIVFADMDMDGWQDILSANGHIEPNIHTIKAGIHYQQTPHLLKNNGQGQFVNISAESNLNEAFAGRGLAVADFDRDGDYDPVFTANNDTLYLYRNDVAKTRWLGLELKGEPPNTHAIGANIKVRAGKFKQQRMVRTGSSYMSQSSLQQLFGLPKDTSQVVVDIRWPGGREQQLDIHCLDRYWLISESESVDTINSNECE